MPRLYSDAQPVLIHEDPIALNQFLKVAEPLTGGEVKALIQQGLVQVNGVPETRRARKLMAGDVVQVDGYGVFQVKVER